MKSRQVEFPISKISLWFIYRSQGRWKEMFEMFMQAIETKLRMLGQEHPQSLEMMANVAATDVSQKRWKHAEAWFLHVRGRQARGYSAKSIQIPCI